MSPIAGLDTVFPPRLDRQTMLQWESDPNKHVGVGGPGKVGAGAEGDAYLASGQKIAHRRRGVDSLGGVVAAEEIAAAPDRTRRWPPAV